VGLFVASVAAMLGLIPPLAGISRVHLMGFLILPTMLYFL
jgi:putative membrane protein